MKKLMVSLFVLFTALGLQAQSYELKMMGGNQRCYLDLFPDQTYVIKLSTSSPDLMLSQIFSFGKYFIGQDGTYKLTDQTHGYVMTMEASSANTQNKVLFVKNSFAWMRNNYFVKQSDKPSSPTSITKDFLKRDELTNYREKHRIPFSEKVCAFINGTYQSENNPDFTFTISAQDSTYSVNNAGLKLSNGKWTKEDNFVVLKDNFSDTPFYLLPGENGTLQSMLIPGDFFLSKLTLMREN